MSTTIQAKEDVKEQFWKDSMANEHESIMKNEVWDVIPRRKGKSVMTSKWLYKIKHGVDGRIEKYNTRFMARGFYQKEGECYDDIFSPVG